jgi:hypothetical protein
VAWLAGFAIGRFSAPTALSLVHLKAASRRLPKPLAAIPGGSFAFVMAIGIVAIAAASQGLRSLGQGLSAVNLAAVAVLSSLMLVRLTGDRAAVG